MSSTLRKRFDGEELRLNHSSLDFPNPALGSRPTDMPGDGLPSASGLNVANIVLASDSATVFRLRTRVPFGTRPDNRTP